MASGEWGVICVSPGDRFDQVDLRGKFFIGSGVTITRSLLTDCDLSQLTDYTLKQNVMENCVPPPWKIVALF